MMTPAVAQALALRIAVKEEQRILRTQETWRSIRGRDHPAYDRWVENMGALVRLLNASLTQDQLPVVEPLRLRLSDGGWRRRPRLALAGDAGWVANLVLGSAIATRKRALNGSVL